jgi:hypothetical protein
VLHGRGGLAKKGGVDAINDHGASIPQLPALLWRFVDFSERWSFFFK